MRYVKDYRTIEIARQQKFVSCWHEKFVRELKPGRKRYKMEIKILTWNINRAAYARKNLWKYLEELNFDNGLFQEVYIIPHEIRKNYYIVRGEMNAILLKKDIFMNIFKENILQINLENDVIVDFCISCETMLFGNKLTLLSIYNYMGPDVSAFSKFLEILYGYIRGNRNEIIIIGGDFNMDEKFQKQLKEWGLLAREMKRELSRLGYIDVLYEKYGENASTFLAHSNKKPYQLDYLFIPKDIEFVDVKVGDKNEIFNAKPRLSDHLPIVATVKI